VRRTRPERTKNNWVAHSDKRREAASGWKHRPQLPSSAALRSALATATPRGGAETVGLGANPTAEKKPPAKRRNSLKTYTVTAAGAAAASFTRPR